jgi:hypothetical protein
MKLLLIVTLFASQCLFANTHQNMPGFFKTSKLMQQVNPELIFMPDCKYLEVDQDITFTSENDFIFFSCDEVKFKNNAKIFTAQDLEIKINKVSGDFYLKSIVKKPTPTKKVLPLKAKNGAHGSNGSDGARGRDAGLKTCSKLGIPYPCTYGSTSGGKGADAGHGQNAVAGIDGNNGANGFDAPKINLEIFKLSKKSTITIINNGSDGADGSTGQIGGDAGNGGNGGNGGKGGQGYADRNSSTGGQGGNAGNGGSSGNGGDGGHGGNGGSGGDVIVVIQKPYGDYKKWLLIEQKGGLGGKGAKGAAAGIAGKAGQAGNGGQGGDGHLFGNGRSNGQGGRPGKNGSKGAQGINGKNGYNGQNGMSNTPVIILRNRDINLI